jgi:Leucine-rich repeat (LRR) protein
MEIALERIANMHNGTLDLSHLGLTELPQLPSTLVRLYCRGNQLTSLPQLGSEGTPSTLVHLYCGGNQLTSLPQLGSEGKPSMLMELYCNNNQLTELPQLPSTLVYLECGDNPIQYPPADVLGRLTKYIREWMHENPLTFVKSANKV